MSMKGIRERLQEWRESLGEEIIRLDEMSKRMPEETGLPVAIWLDNDGRTLQHWNRIKFDPQNGTKNSINFPSLTLSLNPEIPQDHQKNDIRTSSKDINTLKEFMKNAELYRLDLIKKGKKQPNEGLKQEDYEVLFQRKKNGEI